MQCIEEGALIVMCAAACRCGCAATESAKSVCACSIGVDRLGCSLGVGDGVAELHLFDGVLCLFEHVHHLR